MAKANNNNEQSKTNAKKRGKSSVQKTLDKLKEVLKKGTQEHKDAIAEVIQAYTDYKNLATLEKDLEAMKARVETAKATQANEAERERIKAEAEKKKAEDAEKKKKEKAAKPKETKPKKSK